MISYIKGKVTEILVDQIVVESNQIGYLIGFVQQTQIRLNQDIQVFTHLAVKEDDLSLYGFLSREDLFFFQKLLSVKGIGPKSALTILSKTTPSQIAQAVENQDVSYLKSLPGIGNKSASQMILDLKGKLVVSSVSALETTPSALQDALGALKNFGYTTSELSSVKKYLQSFEKDSVNELIRKGLQFFDKR